MYINLLVLFYTGALSCQMMIIIMMIDGFSWNSSFLSPL